VDAKGQRAVPGKQELHELRKELRGHSRQLHERLAEVCEAFLLGPLTGPHKRRILVRELQYLLDYYKDENSWAGVE
jgi:hypothetical protein